MKLLFDENLPFRLVSALSDLYPDSAHVRDLACSELQTRQSGRSPRSMGSCFYPRTRTFYERSALYGAPPKVVWLRIGNAPISATAALLRDRYVVVRRFHDDPDTTFIALPQ